MSFKWSLSSSAALLVAELDETITALAGSIETECAHSLALQAKTPEQENKAVQTAASSFASRTIFILSFRSLFVAIP
jgi:hypothetical protein